MKVAPFWPTAPPSLLVDFGEEKISLIDRSAAYKFHCDGTYGTTLNQTRKRKIIEIIGIFLPCNETCVKKNEKIVQLQQPTG
jgi:hypothetical protein